MTKAKVAPAHPRPQRIPLKDITITWHRDSHFIGEKGLTPVTLTGEQLAPLLGWLTTVAPGNVEGYFEADMSWRLPRMAKTLRALAAVDDPERALDGCGMLAEYLEDLSARIASFRGRTELAGKAFVTIPVRAPKAAVA